MNAAASSATAADFDEAALRRAAARVTHPLARALLVLTFTAGLVDAVSFLGLGRVFTANMTGNVVLLGFGIAGSRGLPVVGPLVSLAGFVVGAGGGGLLVRRVRARHRAMVAGALGVEATLLTAVGVLAAAVSVRAGHTAAYIVIAAIALAMGVRNAIVRRIGIPDLTTTVLTMTLTGLAAESRLAGGSGKGSVRRSAAVVAMLAGAIVGALLEKAALYLPIAVAAALALVTAGLYLPGAARRP